MVLLATQALPIKEVGRMLFKNQIQEEEIAHGSGVCKAKAEIKSDFVYDVSFDCSIQQYKVLSAKYITRSVQLPHNHSSEVQVPPPNVG